MNKHGRDLLLELRRAQRLLDRQVDDLQIAALSGSSTTSTTSSSSSSSSSSAQDTSLAAEQVELRALIRAALTDYTDAFHPRWGPLFKAGHQDSHFAKQVLVLLALPYIIPPTQTYHSTASPLVLLPLYNPTDPNSPLHRQSSIIITTNSP